MRLLGFLQGSVLALLLAGCATPGLRQEPTPVPTFDYTLKTLPSALRGMPVALDLSDCIEVAMVSKSGFAGGTFNAGTTPVRKIVQREFEKMIRDNFRLPSEGEREKAVLKIDSRMMILHRHRSLYDCEMSFDVQILDPHSESVRPYFRASFSQRVDQCRFKRDDIVPPCEYEAICAVVQKTIAALAEDRNAVRRLSAIAMPSGLTRSPEVRNVSVVPGKNGVLQGRCEVACNDWDGFAADRWARTEIRSMCQQKLDVSPERVRVVFRDDFYDSKTKTWRYAYMAFVRAPMVLDFDAETRMGTCVGDLELMRLPADKAAERLKEYVVSEMRLRGGAVPANANVKVDWNALVRFDNFTTDVTANQIAIKFRLVY